MSNEEAAGYVCQLLRQGETQAEHISEDLITTCLLKGSRDNMSANVIFLPAATRMMGPANADRERPRYDTGEDDDED